jgi:ADP-ribose pyrophosphatase YjhB (NUDIX family)
MLREAIGKVWKMLPKAARLRLVRATQTTFTVSVAAIVINEKREVLLLNHVLRPKSGWGFPGGFLDAGEQTHEAVRREVKEETGIDLEDLRFRRALVRGRHVEIIFSGRPVGEARVMSSEIYELGWFEFDSLPEGTAFGQKTLIGEVLNSEI